MTEIARWLNHWELGIFIKLWSQLVVRASTGGQRAVLIKILRFWKGVRFP